MWRVGSNVVIGDPGKGLSVRPWRNVPPWPVPAACDHSQGVALPNRLTHTAGSIIENFQHNFLYFLARVLRSAGRSVLERMIKLGSTKTHPLPTAASRSFPTLRTNS